MKPKPPSATSSGDSLDPQANDEFYGLEPVFEPRAGSGEVTQFVTVQCPYCGESFQTSVDLSAGSFRYVEDCRADGSPPRCAISRVLHQ